MWIWSLAGQGGVTGRQDPQIGGVMEHQIQVHVWSLQVSTGCSDSAVTGLGSSRQSAAAPVCGISSSSCCIIGFPSRFDYFPAISVLPRREVP